MSSYGTKPAKRPKIGNRYTGSNLTSRQAQTIVRMLFKLKKIKSDLEKSQAFIGTSNEIDKAFQALIDVVVTGNRMEELPPALFS